MLLALGTVAAFGAVLVGAEWGLRRADPRYLDRVKGAMVYSEDYGWALRRGFRGAFHGVFTTVNEEGYRGRVHPRAPVAGRTRVVMLGDSITFGVGVTDAETFSALLEERSERFEVINLAVEGYGTDQELIRLERDGLALRPAVVILNFCVANDLVNNAGSLPKPYFTLEGGSLRPHDAHVRLPWWREATQWLDDESHLYHRLEALLPAHPPPARAEEAGFRGERIGQKAAAERTFALIRRIDEVSRAAGARFLVVLHPDEVAFGQRSSVLRRFCRAGALDGIALVDLGARYRALGLDYERIARDEQGHLTALGHHFAAEAIEVAAHGLGPGRSPPDLPRRRLRLSRPRRSADRCAWRERPEPRRPREPPGPARGTRW